MKYILQLFVVLWSVATVADAVEKQHHSHKHHHHHHGERIEVSDFSAAIPYLSLHVTKDVMEGWNIQLITKNFRFAPENANKRSISGEGHAHLFVDGKKVARLYSEWYHLDDLAPGPHVIRVTLNANNHADLVLQGQVIEASQAIFQR